MLWNWELPHWPKFEYQTESILELERKFFLNAGSLSAHLKAIPRELSTLYCRNLKS